MKTYVPIQKENQKMRQKIVKDETLNKKISFNLFYFMRRKRAYLTSTRLRKGKINSVSMLAEAYNFVDKWSFTTISND